MSVQHDDTRPERPDEQGAGIASSSDSRRDAETYVSSVKDKTREELEAAKEYAEMIVNTIREALLVLDFDLRVRSANRSFYARFATTREQTEGRLVYDLGNGQWDLPELRELLEEILPEKESFDDFEVEHDFEHLGRRVMLLNARRIDHHQLILLAIDDVTERRHGERQLRESQERFDLLVENAREYAIFMMDEDARITMWNPGAERILGWKEEEIVGASGDIIFTPEDREAGEPEKERAHAISRGSALDDRWHVRKDGSRFWATGFMVTLRDENGLRGFAKILRDDTKQKEDDEERQALIAALENERAELKRLTETLEERVLVRTRQVRSLASMLTIAEQQERRRISQILHDDLQQQFYGIQLKIASIHQSAEAGERDRVLENLAQLESWIHEAIGMTRSLTVSLSPPLLKGEGLTDALAWLVQQMKELHGLQVVLKAEHAFPMADQDMRVLLFQIVRELLFNVVKHAGVDRATVKLEQLDGHGVIRVIDAGRGFDVEEAMNHARDKQEGGFGLVNVRERLGLFGGRMEIESAPGKGTTVAVYTPTVLELSADRGRASTADADELAGG